MDTVFVGKIVPDLHVTPLRSDKISEFWKGLPKVSRLQMGADR